jgi:hypothetical protein
MEYEPEHIAEAFEATTHELMYVKSAIVELAILTGVNIDLLHELTRKSYLAECVRLGLSPYEGYISFWKPKK